MANPNWESPSVHSKNRVWNGSDWVKQTNEVTVGGAIVARIYTWDVDVLDWVPQPPIGAGFGSGDASEATLLNVLAAVETRLTDAELRADPVDVNITGGGASGTEYTEGDTDASITGTAVLWEDGSNTLRAVSAAKPLPVEIVATTGGGLTDTELRAAPVEVDGSGVTQPVSGTFWQATQPVSGTVAVTGVATEAKQDTQQTALDAIQAAVETLDNTVAGAELQVDIVTSALPSGAATSANQTTLIGHVDGVETLLGTIDADTSALAGTVAGSELQVDVVSSALPSGAATSAKQDTIIGHVDGVETLLAGGLPAALAANGGLKVEGVAGGVAVPISVASIPSHAVTNAGTFAVQVDGAALTALQLIDDPVAVLGTATYTEASTKGTIIAAVRRDADTTLVDTTNEISPLQVDANGRLKVEVFSGEALPITVASVPSHAVTNAGTFAVQVDGAALTSLQLLDDVIKTDDAGFTPATDKVAMVGAQFDDSSPDSVDEGDAGALRMSGRRELYTQLRDAAGNERGANVNASNQLLVLDANSASALTALQLIDDPVVTLGTTTYAEATTKAMVIGAVRRDADTTLVDTTNEISPLHVDANGRLKVEVFSGEALPITVASVPSHAVTNAGTFAVQVDGAALTSLQLIDDSIFTDDAAFTPAASKVTMAGFEADESSTDSVDEGDAGAARMTLDRKLIGAQYAHKAGGWAVATGSINATKTDIGSANTAGQVGGWYIYNPNSVVAYVQFFNTQASGVTLGATAPVYSIGIPATSGANVFGLGIEHTTAISIAITTTRAGSTANSTAVDYNIFYKQ